MKAKKIVKMILPVVLIGTMSFNNTAWTYAVEMEVVDTETVETELPEDVIEEEEIEVPDSEEKDTTELPHRIDTETSVENVVSETDKNEKAVLGTIEELFPHASIQAGVISGLRQYIPNVNRSTSVTQDDLNKVSLVGSNGYTFFANTDLANLHLLQNLKEFNTHPYAVFESTEFLWEQISHLQNLEKLMLGNPAYENGENKDNTVEIPYLPKLKVLSLYWWGAAKVAPYQASPTHRFDGTSINATNLPSIEELYLQLTPLSTYDGIGTLATLKTLHISTSLISDISFLSSLINLESIDITGNHISDFSSLQNLNKLTKMAATGQRVYYGRDDAITYERDLSEVHLPAVITLPDGTTLNSSDFTIVKPVGGTYIDQDNSIFIKDLKEEDLFEEANMWYGDYDYQSNLAVPYIAKNVARTTFSKTLPNGLGSISGAISYEINIKPYTPPTIHAVDKVLTVGDIFDPLQGVTAVDKNGNDLTNKVVVTENNVPVDMARSIGHVTTVGVYQVNYQVEDGLGLLGAKTISVIVNEKVEESKPEEPKPEEPNTGGSGSGESGSVQSKPESPKLENTVIVTDSSTPLVGVEEDKEITGSVIPLSGLPKTGEASNRSLHLFLLGMSGLLAILGLEKRKKQNS